MKVSLLLTAILVAAASKLRVPTDERLAQIDSTEYGKGLIDTI